MVIEAWVLRVNEHEVKDRVVVYAVVCKSGWTGVNGGREV